LPVTAHADLFAEVVSAGRQLLWWHTYCERFVPPGKSKGRVPAGRAKSLKGISTAAGGGPEDFGWIADPADATQGVLQVGEGRIGPVSYAAWTFSVSGYEVLKSWLAFRMQKRSGRKSMCSTRFALRNGMSRCRMNCVN